MSRHSETLEPIVVYQAMYGEYGIWARLAKMWNKCVIKDGKAVKRFEYVGD